MARVSFLVALARRGRSSRSPGGRRGSPACAPPAPCRDCAARSPRRPRVSTTSMANSRAERAVGRERLQDRADVGEPAGLDQHAAEMRNLAAVAVGDQLAQRDLQVGAGVAAQAAVAEQRDLVGCSARSSASSMPTEPNSLTISAVPRPSGVSRNRRTSVVLPAPRKPVTIVTGSRDPRSRFCRRPKRPAAAREKIEDGVGHGRTSPRRARLPRSQERRIPGIRGRSRQGDVRATRWLRNPSPGSTARRCGGRRSRPPRAHRRTRR